MSMNCRKLVPGALAVSGMLLGVFLASPAVYAAETVILVPEDDRDGPEGSQIPDWRISETEEKVREYKEKMKETAPVQRQEQSPPEAVPKPKAEQP